MDKEIFKLRIKDILAEKNITYRELSERMGKAPQYINNIINGGKGVSIATLVEIARTLNVEFRDLFAYTGSKSQINGYLKVNGKLYEIHSFEDLEEIIKLRENENI
jgi:transcriptional regulator with XRE-family HTH domain